MKGLLTGGKTISQGHPPRLAPTARLARGRLSDAPAGALGGEELRRVEKALSWTGSAVEALRRLRPLGAALLESRTEHPGARHSIIAFRPLLEITAGPYHLEEATPLGSQWISGPPWERLCDWLEAFRFHEAQEWPFTGGWVGYLAHEAGSWHLDVSMPSPAPPARPDLPWAHFRLFTDALVVDHSTSAARLFATDIGADEPAAHDRLRRALTALESPPLSASAPARATEPAASTMDAAAYADRVERLRELVQEGDCFQANLTASFAYPWIQEPDPEALVALYDEYAHANPGAWGAFYETRGAAILSSSPELLADVRAGRLRLRPIAGTRPRGADEPDDERLAQDLRTDEKERAEHAMLVDLARNDAASVCRPGTVHVPNFGGVERYRHVMHLVSQVEGDAQENLTVRQLLEAVFPGGSVTGAPKRRAVHRIAQLEGAPRGPYTGSLGYVSFTGSTQWNLLIRTLIATPTHLVAHAGCGIVEGSRPAAEWQELQAKARAQIEAALGLTSVPPSWLRCGRVDPGPAWRPASSTASLRSRRVLLVDFEDSFVRNLADYCQRLGAETMVWSVHAEPEPAWYRPPTHLILSPGPGRPDEFPNVRQHLMRAERAGVPVLGVCLGHQAIGQLLGAEVVRHAETVHGKASPVLKTPDGQRDPVVGSWQAGVAARYHSLVVQRLPETLQTLAKLADGTVMAMRHNAHPIWGVQFHPESILTDSGLDLIRSFLEVPGDG